MRESTDKEKPMKQMQGSFQSRMMEASLQPEPVVGMAATVTFYTDRHAGTVIEVLRTKAGAIKAIRVQEDKATRTDKNGMSEVQSYSYEPNPEGRVHEFKYRDGQPSRKGSPGVALGFRQTCHDFSF